MDPIEVETAGGVMKVTLADVANRNTLTGPLIQGLYDALASANADEGVRAVLLTNQGNTFCAGANLKQRSGVEREAAAEVSLEALLQAILASPTPVVARIAGHVVGGGNGLAAACDISIAADDVRFGFTEVRLGLAPAIVSVVCLPKMRPGEAMEVFLRGHRFSAARAAELGLINRAVPRAELDAAVEEVLADLRLGGPKALAAAKRLVHEVPRMDPAEAFPWTAKLSAELFRSEEGREGMAAFLAKRKPAWAAHDGSAGPAEAKKP